MTSSGSFEDVELIPGTEIMADLGGRYLTKSRRKNIVLVPQPTEETQDPLNWSPRWKIAAISVTVFVTFAQTLGPLAISPVFPQLIEDFESTLDEVIQFTGITILLLGFGNWLWIPMGDTFGRRPVLIFSEIVTIIGAIWRATATSYQSFYGASALLGIGTGMAVQPAIIADVTFLHERGFYNTLFFATFFFGIMLGPILQGVMAQNSGWRSFWWLNTALNCLGLILVIVAFPETSWKRDHTIASPAKPKNGSSSVALSAPVSDQPKRAQGEFSEDRSKNHHDSPELGRPNLRQYWLFQPNQHPIRQLVVSCYIPFKLFTFPIILWAGLIQSWSSSVYLSITFVQSAAFSAPPYNFSTESVGFVNFASLVGAFIGLFTAGPLSDWISIKLTARNGGIREAEMRLPALIPYAAIMILGSFVVAFGLQYRWDWRAIVIIGYGCAGIQATALSSIASTYAIDSYMPIATPIFIIVTLARDLWGYGISKFFTPWAAMSGYVPPFMLNMCLLSLWLLVGGVFYYYGKSVRRLTRNSWVHRYHDADLREIWSR